MADVHDGYAHLGGVLATGLRDVTTDLAALDGQGWWAVVVDYEGKVTCARFDRVRRAPLPAPARPWHGPRPGEWRSSLDRAAYESGVRAIRALIEQGEVYQANLCRILSATAPPAADPLALAARLASGNPAPYAAVIRVPGLGVVSASPELYLSRDGDVVESRPIKGTGVTTGDLLEKDYAENVMIVDLVRNDLGRVAAVGSVEVPALCAVEEHPGLVHLVSTVRARLAPGTGWPELFAATFPPGSVTGAPKSSAVRIINELEPAPRGPYCGAVGWVDADRRTAALAVGIRTFWLSGGEIRFGTGAGITWGSDPGREWLETELKAARLIALASTGGD
ncbi:anthranilate synthase component I family protein [Nonomuraea mesophila]|uniref:Anthranilate synthase component I family protein n=1 Tax=Nonomuraea mesophila TaxID=2530382 RepID=A0A4R5F3Z6_9ACTN|nr:chorismate-binding protein [Nonomuraea mesophila]TDE42178.1 anthranilate synthase component I family protein [Nonomuraea mesophila]